MVPSGLLRLELFTAQGGICPWCLGTLPDDLTRVNVDHVIPKCRGGPGERWNLQLLHDRCNWAKRSALTEAAKALAAEHGVALREPKPSSWPGRNRGAGARRNVTLFLPSWTIQKARQLTAGGMSHREAALVLGVPEAAVARALQ